MQSVRKTNRVVVVEETWRTGGFSGEVASTIQEEAFDDLDGPVARVGGVDVPAPYNGMLEAATIPTAERVLQALNDSYGI